MVKLIEADADYFVRSVLFRVIFLVKTLQIVDCLWVYFLSAILKKHKGNKKNGYMVKIFWLTKVKRKVGTNEHYFFDWQWV